MLQQVEAKFVVLGKRVQFARGKRLESGGEAAGTGITAVGGIEDLIAGRVSEHARRFAVAEEASVAFVFSGIDQPDIGITAPFG